MSAENGTPETPAGSTPPTGPRPEPIRFFGTSWVGHDHGYTARRIALAAGSLAAAAVACLVLCLAYQGLQIADIGSFVTLLVVVMFAVCSALAFRHTWAGFSSRPDPDRQASLRGLLTIGFIGSLLAYAFRCLIEAPGEKLHRTEYEAARARHEKRTTRRSGNPKKRRRP
ncbi:EamA/RhaT family transporter [Streptomyces fumanus]|uniref:Membrane protein n=1 Tax=Streptomyces fumanus TaxID=67302 RepID=A0A919A526_9ACTN|nr:EamA/RhaT family transporter [Streptomyces fumanus]GHE87435.1 membrane protein [Streptomyces fumanus]